MTSPQEIAVGADEGWIIPNVGVILYDISVFITTLKQCLIENVPLSFLRIRVVSEAQKLRESLQTGLTITEALWPPLRQAYEWLHQAAHLLAHEDQQSVATLKASYERLLSTMTAEQEKLGELAHAVTHFCKVAASYWEGLFACYQLKDLPRTNNALEQYFGSSRHVERRVTGRKGASPALVVRGAVRVVAAGASRLLSISVSQLQITNVAAWRALRQQVAYRQESRRCQLRFRRDPNAYLMALEQRLCILSLPS